MHDVAWRCDMNCVRSKDAHKQLARTSLKRPVGHVILIRTSLAMLPLLCDIKSVVPVYGYRLVKSRRLFFNDIHSTKRSESGRRLKPQPKASG